ncbi:MAG: hypothetical protein JXR64_04290, partial [Spirochaetales bacterium]|nr:hypothetical protein [Spirochaetales bacterium]
IILKNKLTNFNNDKEIIDESFNFLKKEGVLVVSQVYPRNSTRISSLITNKDFKEILLEIENIVFNSKANPLTSWSETDLEQKISTSGFSNIKKLGIRQKETRVIKKEHIDSWFNGNFGEAIEQLNKNEVKDELIEYLKENICEKEISWESEQLIIISEK